MTFCATANCVLYQRAGRFLADVSADTLNLDPAASGGEGTGRTKAILPVGLFGHAADLDRNGSGGGHGLTVIEDASLLLAGVSRAASGSVAAYDDVQPAS